MTREVAAVRFSPMVSHTPGRCFREVCQERFLKRAVGGNSSDISSPVEKKSRDSDTKKGTTRDPFTLAFEST
jgi:hypothetical protein